MTDKRNQIILVCPASQAKGEPPMIESEYSDYPSLGLLTLGSSLMKSSQEQSIEVDVLYFDGALWGNEKIYDYIEKNFKKIFSLCFSCFNLNFKSCLQIMSFAKKKDQRILTICGNDHFSILYDQIMQQCEDIVDFGFCGNDVVNGFTSFMLDKYLGRNLNLEKYPGLVYRSSGEILKNEEDPTDYANLPQIDYNLINSLIPQSQDYYFFKQEKRYKYMEIKKNRGTVIDFARGCIKYTPINSFSRVHQSKCEFCYIYPGTNPIVSKSAEEAWNIMTHAYRSGYNYFFLATDEMVLTFWPLIKEIAENPPGWFKYLPVKKRPSMWMFSRADAFDKNGEEKVDIIIRKLNCDHINVGLDGFSNESIEIMNKGLKQNSKQLQSNFNTCELLYKNNAFFSIGGVLTHIGITRDIMEENFRNISYIVKRYASNIIEYSFDLVLPSPGNRCYEYLVNPLYAVEEARRLGVEVNERYLEHTREKYKNALFHDEKELILDFIRGCCPDITVPYAMDYLKRLREVLDKNKVQYDCDMLLKEGFLEE